MARVLFLIQDRILPSSRVRVLNVIPELEQAGIQCEVCKYPPGVIPKIRKAMGFGEYDIIYVQKKLPSPLDTYVIRNCCNKLIYDFDDAVYFRHDASDKRETNSNLVKFKHIAKHADLVIAGNRILAEFARKYSDNVVIVPSAVKTRDVAQHEPNGANGRCIVGWVGGGQQSSPPCAAKLHLSRAGAGAQV